MANLVTRDYPCAQKDLYSILETAWANYQLKLSNFTAHKAMYTAAYKTTALAAVAAAKAMPDEVTRNAAAETLRVALVKLGDICLMNFRMLRSYIEGAFTDQDIWSIQFNAAGQTYYADAANEDWESLDLMNQAAKNYISLPANATALAGTPANSNMPATFLATLTIAANNFNTQYLAFKSAEETSPSTAAKVSANNACYKTLMGMMRDGQVIFSNDLETKKLFTFSVLLDLINPPIAGVKGEVRVIGTNEPISGANISIQKEGEVAVMVQTDDEGQYHQQVGEGKYSLTVSASGFVSQSKEANLKADGFRTFDWLMEIS